jgi:hypothetical protein
MRLALVLSAVLLPLACAPTGPAVRGETPEGAVRCASDVDCSPGDECIRPRGERNGLCGRVADANGQPSTGVRRSVAPCANDFDCPVRSRCQLTTSTVGVCVEQ